MYLIPQTAVDFSGDIVTLIQCQKVTDVLYVVRIF